MTAHTGSVTATTAISPGARQLWLRSRGPLLTAAVLLLAGLLIALLRAGDSGTLHPRSPTDRGSRAVTELLAARGVDTTVVTTARDAAQAAGPDTTLLVVRPESLTPRHRTLLRDATAGSGARTVLVAPGPATLDVFAPQLATADPTAAEVRAPRCADPVARRAGSALLGGYRYRLPRSPTSPNATACYPDAGLPALVTVDRTVLLGSPDILYNEHLDQAGNASLALQLLGAQPRLVWYLPTAADAPAGEDAQSLLDLLDPGWRWAVLQLAIAVALAALWRGRRLGPAVTEPLPVTVRAAETTEGHARLYHRAGARDRAAAALRHATRTRLAPLVGLSPTAAHAADAVPVAVAAHTDDSSPTVHALLFGPPPADDADLVALADRLDALEQRVTHTPTDPTKGRDARS